MLLVHMLLSYKENLFKKNLINICSLFFKGTVVDDPRNVIRVQTTNQNSKKLITYELQKV